MLIIEEEAYKIKNWSKYQSEKEKSNVIITENNAQEDNTVEENLEKSGKENENNNGFRGYKI